MYALLARLLSIALEPGVVTPPPEPIAADPVSERQPAEDLPEAVEAPPAEEPVAVQPAATPAPDVAKAQAPAAALGTKAAPAAAAEEKEPPNRLLPPKEAEIMADAAVDTEKVKFKAGKGLSFQSKDKRFAMQIRLRAQMLYTLLNDAGGGTTEHGLTIRRARLVFGGNFFGEHIKYKTEFGLSPRDMNFRDGAPSQSPIFDWYFEFDKLESLTFRVGQYKVPYSRQRVVSSGDLQMVDRSIANGEFNLDRDVGFDFRSKDFLGWGKLRYYAGVYLGEGRDPFETDDFKLFYLGRIEVLPLGLFEDYSEADFERSTKPKLSLGAAYAFVDGAKRNRGILGSTPSDGGTTDYHNVTADLVFKIAGFSATGEFFYRHGQRDFGTATETDDMGNEVPAPLEASRNGVGWFGQAAFLIPRTSLELASRYGQIRRLGSASGVPVEDELGGALSYYFARHPLKLQLDYFHLWADERLRQGRNQIRLQLQASF